MTDSWKIRHYAAWTSPEGVEVPIVSVISGIKAMADRWAEDYVLRVGIADLITGARVLLNGDLGLRLDLGTLDRMLCEIAEQIDFDLDMQEFRP